MKTHQKKQFKMLTCLFIESTQVTILQKNYK